MNMKRMNSSIAWCLMLAFSLCGRAAAQCSADWKKTDGYPGVPFLNSAFAVTSWDPDGGGSLAPRLVVAGSFEFIADRAADAVAAFDPESGKWEDLGGGVHPGFPNVLCTFQDDLIAAGGFTDAGGVAVTNIARWDGESWSALGSGIVGTP